MTHRAIEPLHITPALAPIGALLALVLLLTATVFPVVGHQLALEVVPVRVASTTGNPPPEQLFLRIQGSEIRLNGAPVTHAELPDTLRKALAGQPDGLVFVSLDGTLAYHEALALLSLVAQVGGKAVGLVSSQSLQPTQPTTSDLPASASLPATVPSSPEVSP